MVGLCVCINLGDPIDAPVDILHGDPRFLFLHLMWQSLSPQTGAKLFNPLPDIWDNLKVCIQVRP